MLVHWLEDSEKMFRRFVSKRSYEWTSFDFHTESMISLELNATRFSSSKITEFNSRPVQIRLILLIAEIYQNKMNLAE